MSNCIKNHISSNGNDELSIVKNLCDSFNQRHLNSPYACVVYTKDLENADPDATSITFRIMDESGVILEDIEDDDVNRLIQQIQQIIK